MLTARGRLEDKLLGFEAGADDYLTKPFELRELAARVQVLHKRQQRQSPAVLHIGDLSLDITARTATRQDQPLSLSPRVPPARSPDAKIAARHVVCELAQALWGDAEHDPARLHHPCLAAAGGGRSFLGATPDSHRPRFGYRIVSLLARKTSLRMRVMVCCAALGGAVGVCLAFVAERISDHVEHLLISEEMDAELDAQIAHHGRNPDEPLSRTPWKSLYIDRPGQPPTSPVALPIASSGRARTR